ncbi:adenine deaminase [Marinivivus vitaminiproducens]|uniref:adenine deaminase n=1 Tax=Marinivivus vitaminiproducens TaxID=3035935 RepID=UPI002797EB31|nr:adenine deaminase [Geminicoccaceae bacterium SCSIO 64248]
MAVSADDLARRIEQAAGRAPADLVIRNARLLNLSTGSLDATEVAITGDTIVGTYETYEAAREIDAGGRIVVPGFIDTHVHIESSMVTPAEFERLVLPRGTTTAIVDPHEIANVLGTEGIRYILDSAEAASLGVFVQLSSCVPSSHLETSGARLEAGDLVALRDHPKAYGLAEFMNFPGVIAADPGCLAKIAAFADRVRDGHSPLLSGKGLNAYLAAGIQNDHEATRIREAEEKLKRGMHICMREGSLAKDVKALAALLDDLTSPFMSFCTDDRNPLEIVRDGHIDHAIRVAIKAGAPPVAAYRAATVSAARAFRLYDRGLVAPGYRADLVLLDDLETCQVADVLLAGRPIADALSEHRHPAPVGAGSVRLDPVEPSLFAVEADGPGGPVIGVVEGSLITEHLTLDLPFADGQRLPDVVHGVHKVAVLARHGVNRNVGRAFVRGFGSLKGALATSVGHDSHNITVVGADDRSMATAVNRVIAMQGGLVAARDDHVLADLPLPLAGLMSDRPYEEVTAGLERALEAARTLGCGLAEPYLQMAFLPLPVIPHLKLTDHGLVDVDRFTLLPG